MNLPIQSAPVQRGAQAVSLDSGLMPSSTCVSVSVGPSGICLNLPVVGNVCIPVSIPVPIGTVAQACIDVCTKFGIPTGACVTVTALGKQIAQECFGLC